YVYGLVGGLEEEFVDFNAHTDHILTNLSTPNTTMPILRPLPQFYQASVDSLAFCQESSYFYLEQLRDFYKHMCLIICVRNFEENFGRTKNGTLEGCVQNIENILKVNYLDTGFLNLLVEDNNKVNNI
ncbi:14664_t:CDS:2, partial [Rhizophagus irregularis]